MPINRVSHRMSPSQAAKRNLANPRENLLNRRVVELPGGGGMTLGEVATEAGLAAASGGLASGAFRLARGANITLKNARTGGQLTDEGLGKIIQAFERRSSLTRRANPAQGGRRAAPGRRAADATVPHEGAALGIRPGALNRIRFGQ